MTNQQPQTIDLNTVFNVIFLTVFAVMMFKMIGGALVPSKERPTMKAPAKTEEVELRERKQTLENKGKEIAREAGVEFVRLETGWEAKYAIPRYWFKGPKGYKIVATDLNELKEKLAMIGGSSR